MPVSVEARSGVRGLYRERVFRRPGTLLPLERRVLEIAVDRAPDGVYGFSLAQDLAGRDGDSRLVAHGTLYKALDRMRKAGLLTAEWEDAAVAADEGRPRRRVYQVTAEGRRALVDSPQVAPRAGWGQAPA
jgi:PadR family transcriptional regulator, regulatory protein PadR